MASTHQEYVFRFFTVRSGNLEAKVERAPRRLLVYSTDRPTELGKKLQQLHDSGASQAEIQRVIVAFQGSPNHVKSLRALSFDVQRGLDWIAENSGREVESLNFAAAIQQLYGTTAAKIVASAEYLTTLDRISDTIVAESFRASWQDPSDPLSSARKWLALIAWVAKDIALEGTTLGAALADITLAIADFAILPRPETKPPSQPDPKPDPKAEEQDRLRKRLTDLEQAHREVSRKIVDEDALLKPKLPTPSPSEISKRMTALDSARVLAEVERSVRGNTRVDIAKAAGGTAILPNEAITSRLLLTIPTHDPVTGLPDARLMLKPEAIAQLSSASRTALADAKIDLARLQPFAAVNLIEEEMHTLSAQVASSEAATIVMSYGGAMFDTGKLREYLYGPVFGPSAPVADRCNFQAGVGDLLMVKQTLKAYELSEFAHVENVLAGEERLREHRRLNVREEIVTTEEERETEKERNLQSTERNEMQSEAEKTVKSQFELEAGLQVSGSYGPAVSFSASLNAGFSTSTEETTRKAVSYSREVTEKTSERVRERVKNETRRRMLEQVEELNRHGIENKPATNGHIRGIYRWLNKVYDAQVFNYGKRMMFEFVVPEPAAYLLYALIENPPRDETMVKPELPTYLGGPLKPSHLTRTNYQNWVAKYQVRNAPVPPAEFQHVAVFDKQDHIEGGSTFGRATKVDVPTGYEAYGTTVMTDYNFTEGQAHRFRVMVGGTNIDCSDTWGGHYRSIGSHQKEVGIAYKVWRGWCFAIAVEIHCRLTAEGFGKWQQAAYDSIMEAYLVQKSVYEEKLAAKAIQAGVKILGRNPLENRRIEREELKKLVIMMLTGTTSISRNSMQSTTEPNIDIHQACINGAWIRFFENAFEWNNILYVLYPYFWGRKARWITALHFTDPDLDFAAFLKAGAARVQVPVRPGFEKAVAHFCQFGEIWEGNDPPLRDDALYVPIIEEITENLGKLDEGVPYPEDSQPWEVRVPTSLVLLQNLEEIPGIRDALTGNVVAITE
jgi:hypothetical protein